MKALVIYDSAFGNTAQVAQAIGNALAPQMEVRVEHVGSVRPEQLADVKLLIAGSPTQKFRPTAPITEFLKGIPAQGLQGVKVAAFDTRIALSSIESSILRFIVNMGGYAAKPIASKLKQKGGEVIMPPEGFVVEDKEGPLKAGELERAAEWAKQMVAEQLITA
jgi:flavodoxin I